MDEYQVEPVHFGGNVNGKWKYKIGADCPKSYSNAIVKYFKDVKIGVLSIFDDFIKDEFIINEVFDDRYYLIDRIEFKGRIYTDISICPYFIVDELIKKDIVVKCLGYIKYTKYENGNNFCWMVKNSYTFLKEFNTNVPKNIVNCFIGSLNKKYKSDNIGFITRDGDVVKQALVDGFSINWDG